MATIKKTAVKATPANTPPKPAAQKGVSKTTNQTRPIKEKSGDELVAENFAALSNIVASLGKTLEMLVQKTESMAYHIIATEEIVAELVAANGLNLANVNTRIRVKIAAGTNNNGNANQAIDVAASIASPLPRQ